MPDDGPWAKYQKAVPQQAQGPWSKYAAPPAATVGTPIADTSSAHAGDAGSFFDPKKLLAGPGGGIGGGPIGNPFDFSKIENYTQEGRKDHPILSRVGDVSKGVTELLTGGQSAGKPMGTSSGIQNNPVTMAMALAPDAAALGAGVERKLLGGADELAKINKVLGVGPKEIRVGKTPGTMEEFASNPARAIKQEGMSAKDLAKMNPLERLQKVTQLRDAAGAKLDSVLQASNKPIDIYPTIDKVFDRVPDGPLKKQAIQKMTQILEDAGVKGKDLSKLTPMEARTVQRNLDEFANFAPEGAYKTFSDIATELRRGISKTTVQAIPEVAPLDQNYGDLAGASKAARNTANKYARTVPVSTLRKMAPWIIGSAIGAGGVGAAKHLIPSSPTP
jgi:hypothetical protein